jgi:sulfonate transport system permease protein
MLVGIKQAWSFAWHVLIGAEILMAASIGLGHVLLVRREFQVMEQIIAAIITIFIIGWIFELFSQNSRTEFKKNRDRIKNNN